MCQYLVLEHLLRITLKKIIMTKYQKLVLGLVLDALGYVSFAIPLLAEFSDIIWAPVSGYLMTKMYQGKSGKIAGIIAFLEEISPGLDVIPTFTLMWLYTYVIRPKDNTTIVVK